MHVSSLLSISIEDLRQHDAHLRDLFDWYRNHAAQSQIQTVTYFESRGVRGVLPIVNPTSAHPGVGEDSVGLEEDHLSIAKPGDSEAQVCDAARRLLRNHVLAAPPAVLTAPADRTDNDSSGHQDITIRLDAGALTGKEPVRIPRELPPAAHNFFGREAERKQLTERLRSGLNTAVVGPAGLGKTALAANALTDVVGANASNLAGSPFPDGLVYIDVYSLRGQVEPAWNTLANRICGVEFMERRPARERATEACRARQILVIVEGGEELGGSAAGDSVAELFSVLSPENRWLLLTRVNTQSAAAETVYIRDALSHDDAAALLDWLTGQRPLASDVRQSVLELLEGHPLALNWAGNLLASEEQDPAALVSDWKLDALPGLSDPKTSEHTLRWLFERSVRGLDGIAREALTGNVLLFSSATFHTGPRRALDRP